MNETIEQLKSYNIDAEEYKRGPLGKQVFAAGIMRKNRGIVREWDGAADVEVFGDIRHHQAVIRAVEKQRRISRHVATTVTSYKRVDPRQQWIRRLLQNRIGVALPSTARFTISNVKTAETKWSDTSWEISGDVTAVIPASRQTLLVGMDETYNFIAALKGDIKSVEQAHQALRPPGLPQDTQRRGEWFFVPVSNTMARSIDKMVMQNPHRVGNRNFEPMSTHYGTQVISIEKTLYAVGYVLDSRTSHHSPLWLPEWHKVVRNREVHAPAVSTRRYWD